MRASVERLMQPVMDAMRAIQARGQYPSCLAIAEELGLGPGKETTVHYARKLLIEQGLIAFNIRSAWSAERRRSPQGSHQAGLNGRTPAERAEAVSRAERTRQEHLAAMRDRDADLPRLTGRLLIDVLSSPSLNGKSPAFVSRVVRRRCRRGLAPTFFPSIRSVDHA